MISAVTASETLAAAREAAPCIIDSLVETFPGMDWDKNATHFWSRVVQHGRRCAEEMREAAATVREAGFDPFMAAAIADRQQWVADLAQAGIFDDVAPASWRELVDRILQGEATPAA